MKKILIVVLSMLMVLSSFTTVLAATTTHLDNVKDLDSIINPDYSRFDENIKRLKTNNRKHQIEILENLTILRGTENGLELDKGLTRAEGAVIFSRLLYVYDKEHDFKVEFTDVPQWALNDVSYIYGNDIIKGISETEFGSNNDMTAEQFTTLVLRALGYDDGNGDFVWDKSLEKAVEIGLLTEKDKKDIEKDSIFTREEVAIIAYNALFQHSSKYGKLLIQETLHKTYDPLFGYSDLIFEELDKEEVLELEKLLSKSKYKIFNGQDAKKEKLYKKVEKLIDRFLDVYTFYINEEVVDIEIKKVNKMDFKYFEWEDYALIDVEAVIKSKATGTKDITLRYAWRLDGDKLKLDSVLTFRGQTVAGILLQYYDDYTSKPSQYTGYHYYQDRDYNRQRRNEIAKQHGMDTMGLTVKVYFHDNDIKEEEVITVGPQASFENYIYMTIPGK